MGSLSNFTPVTGWQKWLGLAVAVVIIVVIAKHLPFVKSYV